MQPNPYGEKPSDQMRIGTVEREAVIERLQSALAEGRLDVHEFDERVAQVYVARTAGELVPLTSDLPLATSQPTPAATARPARSSAPAPAERHPDGTGRALVWAWRAWALAVSVNLVVWLLVSITTQDLQYFWPMWVAGPWGVVLLVGTVFRNVDRPPRS